MATIPEAFAIAVEHHQGGRLQAAEQIYRKILGVEPNHADAIHLLGVIAHQVGKHEVAVQYIERAIRLQGSVAPFHNNLGEAFRALRRISEALACYRRALELRSDYADAHGNLGNALKGQGKLDEAVACYRRALELNPDHAEAHSNLGVAFKNQGKLDEAVACYGRALELKPDFAEAYCNLGNAFKDQERLDDAVACYRRAVELEPDLAEAHASLSVALREVGKPDEALASCRWALELKPDYAEAHGNLGTVLEEIGDLQGEEDSFRAALAHDSRFAFAHYKLAELLRNKLPQQDFAAQHRLLEQGSTSGEQTELTDAERLLLHFGIAQVLDAWGEYAEAAEHLERGNALQLCEWRKRGQEYDPKGHELLVTRMIAVCTADFFQRVSRFGLESEIPVFVVGLPRSGTTLVEQVLAGHSQVFAAGEIQLVHDAMAALGVEGADPVEGLHRLNRQTALGLAARHLAQLRALSPPALRIVDKRLENYLFLGLLAGLFPRAKFIHCRRDLRDVAVSCWMTNFAKIRWANDQQHIATRFQEYRRMMEHWRKVLPVPMLEVAYEETVADLEGVARRLVAWCGLAWEPSCLEFHRAKRPVRTASVVQVRRPLYGTSVARWKHYEKALGPLFARLETMLR